jgi:hypothetical protein
MTAIIKSSGVTQIGGGGGPTITTLTGPVGYHFEDGLGNTMTIASAVTRIIDFGNGLATIWGLYTLSSVLVGTSEVDGQLPVGSVFDTAVGALPAGLCSMSTDIGVNPEQYGPATFGIVGVQRSFTVVLMTGFTPSPAIGTKILLDSTFFYV